MAVPTPTFAPTYTTYAPSQYAAAPTYFAPGSAASYVPQPQVVPQTQVYSFQPQQVRVQPPRPNPRSVVPALIPQSHYQVAPAMLPAHNHQALTESDFRNEAANVYFSMDAKRSANAKLNKTEQDMAAVEQQHQKSTPEASTYDPEFVARQEAEAKAAAEAEAAKAQAEANAVAAAQARAAAVTDPAQLTNQYIQDYYNQTNQLPTLAQVQQFDAQARQEFQAHRGTAIPVQVPAPVQA
eukprot:NODE_3055_length_949_cov_88.570560_g3035_i0.p1 GENE.NODE_3055_length_949_cov_88.570560_g3035_i0~~NODE_3055_length_949_cov_88.570560_g3035_i0.p1  ORF type:complete len:262 (+),score=56.07 NODE_3055_length_949_cov_88.570560_g3035_i0:71-787(+)